ncbi:zinc ribbon domain-containing protein [Paenibacillus silviterrae]|uniref:zinc ribbon domain-containing protein n=1 Tax=Paenibacillus silviterrae TaxID=3242194 RepID=UPI0032B2372D
MFKQKTRVPTPNGKISNPLAGLVRCDVCNAAMVYRPYTKQPAHLICSNQYCTNKSARFSYVEDKVIKGLQQWLQEYRIQWDKHQRDIPDTSSQTEVKRNALKAVEKDLSDLHTQKGNLHKLLELGVYSVDMFVQRSNEIAEEMKKAEETLSKLKTEVELESSKTKALEEVIPVVERVLDLYSQSEDPAKKNELLKLVLQQVVYRKEKHQRLDDFTLKLYPRFAHL